MARKEAPKRKPKAKAVFVLDQKLNYINQQEKMLMKYNPNNKIALGELTTQKELINELKEDMKKTRSQIVNKYTLGN